MDQDEEHIRQDREPSEREDAFLASTPGQGPERAAIPSAIPPGDLQEGLPELDWLAAHRPALELTPGYLQRGRERLLSQIEPGAEYARRRPIFTVSPGFRLAYQLVLAFLLFACGFLAADGLVHASRTWLPGDRPYFVKTLQEDLALRLAAGPAQRAELHMEFLRRRMMEAQVLVFEGRFDLVPVTARGFSAHLEQALRNLAEAADEDPRAAGVLARELEHELTGRAVMVQLLISVTPEPSRLELDRVLQKSQTGLIALRELLFPEGQLNYQG